MHDEDDDRDEIDRLVDWQLKANNRVQSYDSMREWTCPHCRQQWHGVAKSECLGSHVKVEVNETETSKSIPDTLPAIPYYWGFTI